MDPTMTASSLKEVLRNPVDNLTGDDFKRFKHRLRDQGRISLEKLEKADRVDTVELMVQVYSMGAGDVMLSILKKMNCNRSAMDLERDLEKFDITALSRGKVDAPALSGGMPMPQQGGGCPAILQPAMSGGPPRMPAPVCLIENAEGGLQTVESALNILRGIQQPLVVVAVVGLYRTGKSYLMNRLAGQQSGFALGSTIESKTKGIWMWCVPHPSKPGHTLLLLDTEGLGDVNKGDSKNDAWIFCLAVLLSSTLVYNSRGTIDNQALEKLHYVTELTNHIRIKSADACDEDDEEEDRKFVHFFPDFVWAVRDFTLEMKIEGRDVTEDEYLDFALQLKEGLSTKLVTNNQAKCIRNFFPTRKCFTFSFPTSAKKMKHLDSMAEADLCQDFLSDANRFCSYVFAQSRVKTVQGGHKVTGSRFSHLVKIYVDTINSGSVPCLENAVVAMAEIENQSAVNKGFQLYEQGMGDLSKTFPTDLGTVSAEHHRLSTMATQEFLKHSFKDEEGKYMRRLMEKVSQLSEHLNMEASEKLCRKLLLDLYALLTANIHLGRYAKPGGYEIYCRDRDAMVAKYRQHDKKGMKGEEVLEKFLQEKNAEANSILKTDERLTESDKMAAIEQAQKAGVQRYQDQQRALEDERRSRWQQMPGPSFSVFPPVSKRPRLIPPVPCLENAVVAMAEIKNQSAVNKSFQLYEQGMGDFSKTFPTDLGTVSAEHQRLSTMARQEFLKHSFKDEEGKYMRRLMEKVSQLSEHLNMEASEKLCRKLLLDLYALLTANIHLGRYHKTGGYEIYCRDRDAMVAKYRQHDKKGMKGEEVLEKFLQEKNAEANSILKADERLTESDKKMAAIEQAQKARLQRYQDQQRALEYERHSRWRQMPGPSFSVFPPVSKRPRLIPPVPCLENAVVAMAEIKNQSAVNKSFQLYEQGMGDLSKTFPTDLGTVSAEHQRLSTMATQEFLKHSFKDEEGKYMRQLVEKVSQLSEQLFALNMEASEKLCRKLLLDLYALLTANIHLGRYHKAGGYEIYCRDRDAMVAKYRQQDKKGMKGEEVLEKFLQEKNAEANSILMADERLTEADKKMAAIEQAQKAGVQRYQDQQRALEDECRSRWQQMPGSSLSVCLPASKRPRLMPPKKGPTAKGPKKTKATKPKATKPKKAAAKRK